ncbi:hypothetical protein [Bifidobacterium moukalabense]|uniref:Membrane protein n=1 Tax=Bifidobacterium moukalabense DSM 27321 TaxID=1435051 RepID=W4N8I1_9BIFI|nr:hypothetical protein [Bifidobacterium moukalabense]ETY70821.1 membrane protein [Bifidobacterium moukalabense DSM 27321]
MGYESLSTVVVLAIVVILMVGWLPRRTVKGMKRVIEHREDRFSPSLHLVDADSGTRFSDVNTPQAKGAIMQSSEAQEGKMSEEHIAQVRALRRAAVRRRRIIVIALAVATIVVIVAAVTLRFSAWFALIPAVALAGVMALGVRASKQARDWERKVARYRSRMKKKAAVERERARAEQAERKRLHDAELAEARRIAEAQAPTDVMPEGEIRQAVERSKADRDRALNKRRQEATAKAGAAQDADQQNAGLSIHDERDERRDVSEGVEDKPISTEISVLDQSAQDLISFSLGAPRNGVEVKQAAPESMEIKSTRQVAKAVPPVEPVEPLIVPSDGMSDMDEDESGARVEAGVQLNEVSVKDFHDTEVSAEVKAPDATSDSLGTGLEAILARRGA